MEWNFSHVESNASHGRLLFRQQCSWVAESNDYLGKKNNGKMAVWTVLGDLRVFFPFVDRPQQWLRHTLTDVFCKSMFRVILMFSFCCCCCCCSFTVKNDEQADAIATHTSSSSSPSSSIAAAIMILSHRLSILRSFPHQRDSARHSFWQLRLPFNRTPNLLRSLSTLLLFS